MKNRHAYLIMAHNQWELLAQLLATLDDERNDIYLHVDKKASPPENKLRKLSTSQSCFGLSSTISSGAEPR